MNDQSLRGAIEPPRPRAPAPEQPAIDHAVPDKSASSEAALQAALAGLGRIVLSAHTLEQTLVRVAELAVLAMPLANGAGIALLGPESEPDRISRRPEHLGSSDETVARVEELQYSLLGEGPAITGATERRVVWSGSLGGDKRFRHFGPRVGRLGLHSVLSLPMLLPDSSFGAISIYAGSKNAFDARSAQFGERFAAGAAVTLANARALTSARALVEQLEAALQSRPVIDQAIGLLRGRSGLSEEQALKRLRVISRREHAKVAEISQRLVDEATARARARGQSFRDSP